MAKTNGKRAPRNIWMTGKVPSGAVTLNEVAEAMERIAPIHLAEEWDNVGLLSGHRSSLVKTALVAIDLTAAVHDEAIRLGADLIVVYHPPIFKPLKHLRINGDGPNALAVALASWGVWVYSPHTALDTVDGGTNDILAQRIGANVTGSFSSYRGLGEFLKLVTFVPEGAVERVAEAVYEAGAGRIGIKAKYSKCSFRSDGHGTFLGDASTNPAVGEAGRYEKVREVRFETILPGDCAGEVVSALRRAHPYEEPAFDLLKMETPPEGVGLGRYAELARPTTLEAFAKHCKQELGLDHVGIIGKPAMKMKNLAIVAGSAGRLILERARREYDCVITGELKHHEMLEYQGAGKAVILLGHWESERPIVEVLADRMRKEIKGIKVVVSRADRGVIQNL